MFFSVKDLARVWEFGARKTMVRGVSHTVGVVLSTNYSQFISDAAHAAVVIASMLAFFYFESGFFFLKARGHLDDAGAWVGTPSASGNLTCGF